MTSMKEGSERPTVKLPQGTIVGVIQEEHFPQPVECFLGFPYCEPPVGELRFRPPKKIGPSSQVFDASKYGPAAPGKPLVG